jgi:uncharacterized protein
MLTRPAFTDKETEYSRMPEYLYRIQPTRAEMLLDGTTSAEEAVIDAHFAYLQAAVAGGVVLLAGRTLNTDSTSFGLVILRAATDAEAMAFMQSDPAVSAGVMHTELYPFRVALLAQGWGEVG